jgi:hypothetical protein
MEESDSIAAIHKALLNFFKKGVNRRQHGAGLILIQFHVLSSFL